MRTPASNNERICTMIITYFRSSSYNTHNMCEQQYFIEYVLGHRSRSGLAADKGTIVHKVMEILAFISLYSQNKTRYYIDDTIGEIDIEDYSLDNIIDEVYEYYTTRLTHHNWKNKDYEDCKKWVKKAVEYGNGMFDPRNRHIVSPEKKFDIIIEKPWAKYSYKHNNENLEGFLGIKGTIDLITKVNDNTIEVIDWKTGKRLDWATGKEKTQEKLEKDPQLMIYYYALQKLYPEIDNYIFTIYFINDGGPFSMTFNKSHLIQTENILREKFNIIRKTKKPKLNRTWKCRTLCHYGKNNFLDTDIDPMVEYRDGQTCEKNTFMTQCEQIKHDIDYYGIDTVIDKYTRKGYNVGSYKAPGTTE